jgi:hypothetical protein
MQLDLFAKIKFEFFCSKLYNKEGIDEFFIS